MRPFTRGLSKAMVSLLVWPCVLASSAHAAGTAPAPGRQDLSIVRKQWTWVSGSDRVAERDRYGVYGTKGVPATGNLPRARYAPVSWTDASGSFWLFGGIGYSAAPVRTFTGLNDLWKWDGTSWTWMSGSNIGGQAGTYGIKGTPAPENVPGARVGAASWTDSNGNFWLFGGSGNGSGDSSGQLNDLWKWDGASWIWVSGSNVASDPGSYGTQGTPSSSNRPGARAGSLAWSDASGNSWLFGGTVTVAGGMVGYRNDLWKWDGTNWTWVSGSSTPGQFGAYGAKGVPAAGNVPGGRREAKGYRDASGNLWLFGGYGLAASGTGALNDLWRWDGTTWTWVSGSNGTNEAGTYGTKGIAAPGNVPGARTGSASWTDSSGSFWLFGGDSQGLRDDVWRWDGTSWTWVAGSNEVNQSGVYGTRGVAAPENSPGARDGSVSWMDASGNLWVFGGNAWGGSLNDLWKWDGTSWTWVSGSNGMPQTGTYGTKGVAAAENVPGARQGSAARSDAGGNLWLFGGLGYCSDGTPAFLNELWKWDGTAWTWVSGSNGQWQLATYGTKGIAAPENVPGGREDSVAWSHASGQLWLFGGAGHSANGTGQLNDLWQWDGRYWTWVSGSSSPGSAGTYGTKGVAASGNVPGARLSAVSWTDTSGNLWLFGGSGYDASGGTGVLNDLWKWDGTNWTWTSGSSARNQAGAYGTKGVGAPGNVPGARSGAVSWTDASGNLWLFGGYGYAVSGPGSLNDLWRFDGTNWTWVSGSNGTDRLGTYGTKGVAAPENVPSAHWGAVSWTDAAGDFWLFGGEGWSAGGFGYLNALWKWDGSSWTWMGGSNAPGKEGTYGTKGIAGGENEPGARTAAAVWTDANGNLMLFGGLGMDAAVSAGRLNDLWVFGLACSLPPPTAGNGGAVCAGESISLSASTIPDATYAWTGPFGFTSSLQNPVIPNATAAMAGTYTVRATVDDCVTAPASTVVTVTAGAAAPFVTAPARVVAGAPGVEASVAERAGSSWRWQVANGTLTSGQGTPQITFTAGDSGVVTVTVQELVNGSCPSLPGVVSVAIAESEPPSVVNRWEEVGPHGGEIYTVEIDPSDPSRVWAATISGVFRSTDGGAHWTKALTSGALTVGLAVHPSNGSTAFVSNRYGQVFRTTDAGATWSPSGTGIPSLGMSFANGKIRFKPGDPSVLYYSWASGLFKSVDGGASWAPSDAGPVNAKSVLDFAIDPSAPGTVYLALGTSGVFKSADGGATWVEANTGLPTRVSGGQTQVPLSAFAMDPSTPRRLYVISGKDSSTYVSEDGGATWTARSVNTRYIGGRSLFVAPGDGETLYCAASSTGAPTATGAQRVFKSADGGATWHSVTDGIWGANAKVLAMPLSLPGTVYAVLGGRLWKTSDGGASWEDASTGLRAAEIGGVAFSASAPSTFYAHARSMGVLRTTDGGRTMAAANGSLLDPANGTVVVDPANPGVVLAAGGGVYAAEIFTLLVRSADGGGSWRQVVNPDPPTAGSTISLQPWGFAALPTTPTTFYVSAPTEGVYKSVDAGLTFVAKNSGLPLGTGSTFFNEIAAADATGATLYVTVSSGSAPGLYRTTNGGEAWTLLAGGLPAGTGMRAVAVHPSAPQRVFAVTSAGQTWRSADGGATWTALGGSFPASLAQAVAIAPSSPDVVVVVGAESDVPWVWASRDGGATWSPVPTDDLDFPMLFKVAIDPSNANRILVGGRGGLATITLDPADGDGDGVTPPVEGQVPSPGSGDLGDGNGDGVPDSDQGHVASTPGAVPGEWVTVEATASSSLRGVATTAPPAPSSLPSGASLPSGVVHFEVGDVVPAGCTTVTLYFPSNPAINRYYKYGPTPDDTSPHWYDFSWNGTTGARIYHDATRTRVVLGLCDGLRGDADLVANGSIPDPGGPTVQAVVPRVALTVTRAGTGEGTVTSDPEGIDCGAACSATFEENEDVVLTALAGPGSLFTGWSGEGCSGTASCSVTMTQARNVTATFDADPSVPRTLTVAVTGSGSVTSAPSGISCPGTCSNTFPGASQVTLTAAPALWHRFAGWSGGACAGTGTCTVTMYSAKIVTATFLPEGPSAFHSITPCRVVDTRNPTGPLGGPALAATATRAFPLGGACGVPPDAAAVSLNVTVADATAAGTLTIYPGTGPAPNTNTLSFVPSKNRANNVTIGLVGGTLSVVDYQATGTVNLIVDVNGYYR